MMNILQINHIARFGIPGFSTCEEHSYPWDLQPKLSGQLESICKENHIACLGTDVNPGFLMDYLPSVMPSVGNEIETIKVERIQDAAFGRIRLQK